MVLPPAAEHQFGFQTGKTGCNTCDKAHVIVWHIQLPQKDEKNIKATPTKGTSENIQSWISCGSLPPATRSLPTLLVSAMRLLLGIFRYVITSPAYTDGYKYRSNRAPLYRFGFCRVHYNLWMC